MTSAPITPKEVSLRYSKGRVLEVVFKNGYKNNGMWANNDLDPEARCKESAYQSEKVAGFPSGRQRIATEPAHCKPDWKHVQSMLEDKATDTLSQFLEARLP